MENKKKRYSLGEEIGNSVTHGIGALFGIVTLVLFIFKADTPLELFTTLLFSLSIILLYTMSTLYHAFSGNKIKLKRLFKRFDHLSIYILIAGSYAPFLLIIVGGTYGLVLFLIQWTLVLIGVVTKIIFINKLNKLHLGVFIAMGWMAVLFFGRVRNFSPESFNLLILGGVSYTVGAVIYATKLFKYSHTVWHLFVLVGTLFHFLCVYLFLL